MGDACNKYDKDPATLFTILQTENVNNYDFMLECLHKQLEKSNKPMNELINKYGKDKLNAITASEMERSVNKLYQDDLYYTIFKFFMFVILLIVYLFFFKNGILQPIKDGMNLINNKVTKISEIKVPKVKLPEVTMPSIKMPNSEK
jgi:hypothetical protein